jgi:hypothetical protein
MTHQIPQPDPFESLGMEPAGETRLLAPAAVYIGASPTREAEHISKRLLDLRPGALIVISPRVARKPPTGPAEK